MAEIKDKIKSPHALKKIVVRLKAKGKRIGFTNGCFDILHCGHIRYLQEARRGVDILIAALNDDSSVKRLKGRTRPIFPLKDRTKVVAGLEAIDYVTYFKEDTPAKIITIIRPDIIIKGGDYRVKDIVGADIVKSWGGRARSVKYHKGYSVTSLIKSIARKSKH